MPTIYIITISEKLYYDIITWQNIALTMAASIWRGHNAPLHMQQSICQTGSCVISALSFLDLIYYISHCATKSGMTVVTQEFPSVLLFAVIISRGAMLLVTCWCRRAKKLHQLWMPHSLQTSRRFLKVKTVSASTTCDGSEFQCDTTLLLKAWRCLGSYTNAVVPLTLYNTRT